MALSLPIHMPAQLSREVRGRSFWPLVTGGNQRMCESACSSRFAPRAGDPTYAAVEGATFGGWVGSGRTIEPTTITSEEWALICAPQGLPSELYNLSADPEQEHDVMARHRQVARDMRRR
jgi:hypothetical protein